MCLRAQNWEDLEWCRTHTQKLLTKACSRVAETLNFDVFPPFVTKWLNLEEGEFKKVLGLIPPKHYGFLATSYFRRENSYVRLYTPQARQLMLEIKQDRNYQTEDRNRRAGSHEEVLALEFDNRLMLPPPKHFSQPVCLQRPSPTPIQTEQHGKWQERPTPMEWPDAMVDNKPISVEYKTSPDELEETLLRKISVEEGEIVETEKQYDQHDQLISLPPPTYEAPLSNYGTEKSARKISSEVASDRQMSSVEDETVAPLSQEFSEQNDSTEESMPLQKSDSPTAEHQSKCAVVETEESSPSSPYSPEKPIIEQVEKSPVKSCINIENMKFAVEDDTPPSPFKKSDYYDTENKTANCVAQVAAKTGAEVTSKSFTSETVEPDFDEVKEAQVYTKKRIDEPPESSVKKSVKCVPEESDEPGSANITESQLDEPAAQHNSEKQDSEHQILENTPLLWNNELEISTEIQTTKIATDSINSLDAVPETSQSSESQDSIHHTSDEDEQPLWDKQFDISSEKQVSEMAADVTSIDAILPREETAESPDKQDQAITDEEEQPLWKNDSTKELIPDLVDSEKSKSTDDPYLLKILDRTKTRLTSERNPSYDDESEVEADINFDNLPTYETESAVEKLFTPSRDSENNQKSAAEEAAQIEIENQTTVIPVQSTSPVYTVDIASCAVKDLRSLPLPPRPKFAIEPSETPQSVPLPKSPQVQSEPYRRSITPQSHSSRQNSPSDDFDTENEVLDPGYCHSDVTVTIRNPVHLPANKSYAIVPERLSGKTTKETLEERCKLEKYKLTTQLIKDATNPEDYDLIRQLISQQDSQTQVEFNKELINQLMPPSPPSRTGNEARSPEGSQPLPAGDSAPESSEPSDTPIVIKSDPSESCPQIRAQDLAIEAKILMSKYSNFSEAIVNEQETEALPEPDYLSTEKNDENLEQNYDENVEKDSSYSPSIKYRDIVLQTWIGRRGAKFVDKQEGSIFRCQITLKGKITEAESSFSAEEACNIACYKEKSTLLNLTGR